MELLVEIMQFVCTKLSGYCLGQELTFCKAEVDVALRMEKCFVLLSDHIGDSIKVITVPSSLSYLRTFSEKLPFSLRVRIVFHYLCFQ
jgi:hypothetical protein